MIDISSPNKTKREVSPERDGWDTKKLALTGKAPDAKKRKLDVEEGKETKSSSKKLKAKTQAMEYQTFEMS